MTDQEKFQEMQILEQNLQSLLMQKQAFQFELGETESAIEELSKTKDDVYKLTGQILIKADKDQLKEELAQKKKIIELRVSSIDKQEEIFVKKIQEAQSEIQPNPSKEK